MLTIIIVNYKSTALLVNCLRTVLQYQGAWDYELMVVDNASGDGGEQEILRQFPQVRWLAMESNAGFARANNAGIRVAKGDAFLLLNPDILVMDEAIGKCYQDLMDSSYAACGLQLLNPDHSPQISGNFNMTGALNNLLPLPYTGNFLKWLGDRSGVKKPHVAQSKGTTEVDWINGAFLMVKSSAVEVAGLMDEDFFLYAEETEWCSRLKKAGKLCLFGSYHVIHLQGDTANREFGSAGKGYYNLYDRKGFQLMVSNFLRIRKQFGVAWYLFHLCVFLLEIPVFFLGLLVSRAFSSRFSFRQWLGYSSNTFRLLGLAPKMLVNRPYFYKFL